MTFPGRRRCPTRGTRERAFTLIEAMVALALIGILLVLGLLTMSRIRTYERIMATKRSAQALAAEVLEEVYRGSLLVELGESEVAYEDLPRNTLPAGSTRVEIDVARSADASDLYDIRVTVRYDSSGLPKETSLASRYWRPR